MSKIVPHFQSRDWPTDLPLESMQVGVLVPYDAETGTVYLNACGADEDEVASALTAIEIAGEARFQIRTAVATLDFTDEAALLSSLFPVHVPVHIETGRVHLGGIGSNLVEADANLNFSNANSEEYRIVVAMMRMPAPSLDCAMDENLLPSP